MSDSLLSLHGCVTGSSTSLDPTVVLELEHVSAVAVTTMLVHVLLYPFDFVRTKLAVHTYVRWPVL